MTFGFFLLSLMRLPRHSCRRGKGACCAIPVIAAATPAKRPWLSSSESSRSSSSIIFDIRCAEGVFRRLTLFVVFFGRLICFLRFRQAFFTRARGKDRFLFRRQLAFLLILFSGRAFRGFPGFSARRFEEVFRTFFFSQSFLRVGQLSSVSRIVLRLRWRFLSDEIVRQWAAAWRRLSDHPGRKAVSSDRHSSSFPSCGCAVDCELSSPRPNAASTSFSKDFASVDVSSAACASGFTSSSKSKLKSSSSLLPLAVSSRAASISSAKANGSSSCGQQSSAAAVCSSAPPPVASPSEVSSPKKLSKSSASSSSDATGLQPSSPPVRQAQL